MHAHETVRAKTAADKGSKIIIKTTFANLVAKSLRELFGLDLVRGTKPIGTTGHKMDWPMCVALNEDSPLWHIDAPAFDRGVRSIGDSVYDADELEDDEFQMYSYSHRAMCVPPSFSITGATALNITVAGTNADSYGGQTTRSAMDRESARKLARDMVLTYCEYMSAWLHSRKLARKYLNHERSRREVLKRDGQGRNWFVDYTEWHETKEKHYGLSWGDSVGGNRWHLDFDSKPWGGQQFSCTGLSLEQVVDMKKAMRVPDKQQIITVNDFCGPWKGDTGYCRHQFSWHAGLPMNYRAASAELKIRWAHQVMRGTHPPYPVLPGKFRSVKSAYRREGEPLKGFWAEECSKPWAPLVPETIAEL